MVLDHSIWFGTAVPWWNGHLWSAAGGEQNGVRERDDCALVHLFWRGWKYQTGLKHALFLFLVYGFSFILCLPVHPTDLLWELVWEERVLEGNFELQCAQWLVQTWSFSFTIKYLRYNSVFPIFKLMRRHIFLISLRGCYLEVFRF